MHGMMRSHSLRNVCAHTDVPRLSKLAVVCFLGELEMKIFCVHLSADHRHLIEDNHQLRKEPLRALLPVSNKYLGELNCNISGWNDKTPKTVCVWVWVFVREREAVIGRVVQLWQLPHYLQKWVEDHFIKILFEVARLDDLWQQQFNKGKRFSVFFLMVLKQF